MKVSDIILVGLILLSFCFCAAYGNKTHKVFRKNIIRDTIKHKTKRHRPLVPERPCPTDDKRFNCAFNTKYALVQRLKMYPFSKAAKILAVSYIGIPAYDDTDRMIKNSNGTTDTIFGAGLHITNGKLNYISLKECKQLTNQQVANLTNIIYNVDYKRPPDLRCAFPGYNCFLPSNALIFFDKKGRIYDYLQICFHCDGYDSYSEKLTIGTPCNQKYELLRRFFIGAGLRYGTKSNK
jgi:mRNA-degrading endonuclease HigB of HigAB toxin-antitoxin module